jgi:hypothetical protein
VTYSDTATTTSTYTLSNAKYVASKVQTDLRQFQRWYGEPSDGWITAYRDELVILSAGGYVDQVKYGFVRGGSWILTIEYRFRYDGALVGDDRAGGLWHAANLDGASFTSYLYWSSTWSRLTEVQRAEVRGTLPFSRASTGEAPYAAGRYASNRTYAVDGSGASRKMFVPA